jgi:hypothetical protein
MENFIYSTGFASTHYLTLILCTFGYKTLIAVFNLLKTKRSLPVLFYSNSFRIVDRSRSCFIRQSYGQVCSSPYVRQTKTCIQHHLIRFKALNWGETFGAPQVVKESW